MDLSNKNDMNYLWVTVMNMEKSYSVTAILAFGILSLVPLFVHYLLLYYVVGIVLLVPFLEPLVNHWTSKEKISHRGKAIIITGCDTGFGHMLAKRMDNLGYHVFAGCLFPDGEGATELRNVGSNRMHVIGLDVTNEISVQEAKSYVDENIGDNILWAVVNNAGILTGGELHWTDMKTIQRIFEVNTMGIVRVTQAFLPKLKESKGRVVTVTSRGGRIALPIAGPYCMSKSAAIAFCDSLRLEMYKWGIRVISVEPTFYKTALVTEFPKLTKQMWDKAPKDVKDMYGPDYIQEKLHTIRLASKLFSKNPSEVVAAVEDGLTALYPEYYYTPGRGLDNVLFWFTTVVPKPVVDLVICTFFGE